MCGSPKRLGTEVLWIGKTWEATLSEGGEGAFVGRVHDKKGECGGLDIFSAAWKCQESKTAVGEMRCRPPQLRKCLAPPADAFNLEYTRLPSASAGIELGR